MKNTHIHTLSKYGESQYDMYIHLYAWKKQKQKQTKNEYKLFIINVYI